MSNRASVRHIPWVPVTSEIGPQLLSLEQTLLHAAEVQLDVVDDLTRSAVLRFLTAMAALTLRHAKYSKRRGDLTGFATDGIPAEAVTKALDSVDDRFDLLHPDTPFMQEPRLAAAVSGHASRLHPKIAGSTDAAWFETIPRGGNTPPLTPAEAIMALLTFYHHGVANNGGPVLELPNGHEMRFSPRPGSMGTRPTRRGDVHLWWRGPNLAATLLMNVKPAWVTDKTLPNWFNEPSIALKPGSLAEWTHSGVTALLVPELNETGDLVFPTAHTGGQIHLVLAATLSRSEYTTAIREQLNRSYNADPRRPVVESTDSNGDTARTPVFGLAPENTPIQNLAALWTTRGQASMERGVLAPVPGSDVAVLAIAAKRKTATVKIESVAWTSIERNIVDTTRSASRLLADLARTASRSIDTQIHFAAAEIFPDRDGRRSPAADAFAKQMSLLYYNRTASMLNSAVAAAAAGEPVGEHMAATWWAGAAASFDECAAVYTSTATAPRIAKARARFVPLIKRRRTIDESLKSAVGEVIARRGSGAFKPAIATGAIDPHSPVAHRALARALSRISPGAHTPFVLAMGTAIRSDHDGKSSVGTTLARLHQEVNGASPAETSRSNLNTAVSLLTQLELPTAAVTLARNLSRARQLDLGVDYYDLADLFVNWGSEERRLQVQRDYYEEQ